MRGVNVESENRHLLALLGVVLDPRRKKLGKKVLGLLNMRGVNVESENRHLLRRDYQQQEGAAWSLQKFHGEVLRHGSPPIRLLREILLKDRSKWDELF